MDLCDKVPDASTLWDFREAQVGARTLEDQFGELNRIIEQAGFISQSGQNVRHRLLRKKASSKSSSLCKPCREGIRSPTRPGPRRRGHRVASDARTRLQAVQKPSVVQCGVHDSIKDLKRSFLDFVEMHDEGEASRSNERPARSGAQPPDKEGIK